MQLSYTPWRIYLTNHEVVEVLKRKGATVVHVTMQMVQRCHKQYLQTGLEYLQPFATEVATATRSAVAPR